MSYFLRPIFFINEKNGVSYYDFHRAGFFLFRCLRWLMNTLSVEAKGANRFVHTSIWFFIDLFIWVTLSYICMPIDQKCTTMCPEVWIDQLGYVCEWDRERVRCILFTVAYVVRTFIKQYSKYANAMSILTDCNGFSHIELNESDWHWTQCYILNEWFS